MLQKARDGVVIQLGSLGSFAKQVKERLQFIEQAASGRKLAGHVTQQSQVVFCTHYMCDGMYKLWFIYLYEHFPVRNRENNEVVQQQYWQHLFSHILSPCVSIWMISWENRELTVGKVAAECL